MKPLINETINGIEFTLIQFSSEYYEVIEADHLNSYTVIQRIVKRKGETHVEAAQRARNEYNKLKTK